MGLTIAGAVILAAAVIFVIFGEKVGSGEVSDHDK